MLTPFIVFLSALTPILANDVVTGNNKFAGDVYKEVSHTSDNFVVSPFSAETVLALAAFGAKSDTKRQLQQGLHLPTNQRNIVDSFRDVLSTFQNKNYVLHTANKLYLNKGFHVKNSFDRVAKDVFGAETDTVNFAEQLYAAGTINRWVEEQTHDKIRDLITPDKLSSDTRAVLVNALYFKADWSSPFRKAGSAPMQFHGFGGEVTVDVMAKSDDNKRFNYAEDVQLGAQFLELPFRGDGASMVLVLPTTKRGIVELEAKIEDVLAPRTFTKQYVNMTIPKFKIESTIDFKNVLQNLGVTKPFSLREADFGGISDDNLVLSDVVQKTFIDVHESGVEAASATYAGFVLLSIHSVPEYKQFHADHPFIFYIKVQDLIVFVGRVTRPQRTTQQIDFEKIFY